MGEETKVIGRKNYHGGGTWHGREQQLGNQQQKQRKVRITTVTEQYVLGRSCGPAAGSSYGEQPVVRSWAEWQWVKGMCVCVCVRVSHPRQRVEKEQFFILHAVLKDSTVLPKTPQPARCAGMQGRNTLICLICPSKQTSPVYIKPGQVGDKTFYPVPVVYVTFSLELLKLHIKSTVFMKTNISNSYKWNESTVS